MILAFLVAANLLATADDGAWRPLLTPDLAGWTRSLGAAPDGSVALELDPASLFEVELVRGEPVLRIDGRWPGALVSDEELESFHLRAEFRWGEAHHSGMPWRDAGLLYHSTGAERAAITGGQVDAYGRGRPAPLADPPGSGAFLEGLEFHVAAAFDRSTHGVADEAVGDFGWFGRVFGDLRERVPTLQRPGRVWNQIEIRAHGDEAVHRLNGTVVAVISGIRRATDRGDEPHFGGRLQLQSSGDEIFWRRLEVRPIDALFAQEGETWERRFERANRKAIQAYRVGRNEEALRRYRDIDAMPPLEGWTEAYEFTALARQAKLLARLRRDDEAFEMARRAITCGWHDAEEIRDSAEFVPYREMDEHQELVRMSHAHAVDDLPTVVPRDHGGRPVPLLIAFHGRGGVAAGFIRSWDRAVAALGWAAVAPRSPFLAPTTMGRMIWDAEAGEAGEGPTGIDLPMARALAERAVQRAEAEGVVVDRERIVLAGYGQGGAVALRLLAESPGAYAGAYALGTRYEPLGVETWRAARAARPIRVVLLMGQDDPRGETLDVARAELEEAGVPLEVVRISGVGHERPLDHGSAWVGGVKTEWATEHVTRQVDALRSLLTESR